MLCDYSLRTEPHKCLKTQMRLRLSDTQENMRYYISLPLFNLPYYYIWASHTTRDYCRLFRDYPATALRLFRAQTDRRAVLNDFRF